MSDHYQVTLIFKNRVKAKDRETIELRLEKAYFKDMLVEKHADSIEDYQPDAGREKGNMPTLDEAFGFYTKEIGCALWCEWEAKELVVSFGGWDCCRNAVRREGRKLMKEMNV